MALFNHFSIGKRLALVLGLILLLCVSSSLYAIGELRHLGAEIDTVVSINLKVERAAGDWLRNTTAGVQRSAAIARSSDASLVEYFAPITAASIQGATELQKSINDLVSSPEERKLMADIADLRKAYLAARSEVEKAKKNGDAEGALKTFNTASSPRHACIWLAFSNWLTCNARSLTRRPPAFRRRVRKR